MVYAEYDYEYDDDEYSKWPILIMIVPNMSKTSTTEYEDYDDDEYDTVMPGVQPLVYNPHFWLQKKIIFFATFRFCLV